MDMINSCINFDTEYYVSCYPDLQKIAKRMTTSEKHLWLLSHFIKSGQFENRKYRFKNMDNTNSDAQVTKKPHKNTPSNKSEKRETPDPTTASHFSAKSFKKQGDNFIIGDDDNDSQIKKDIEERIKKFREKCFSEKGASKARDKTAKIHKPACSSTMKPLLQNKQIHDNHGNTFVEML
jgi:hypothetical protein